MDLFSKTYSCYYQVVGRILEAARKHPVSRKEMEELAGRWGFSESALYIVPKLMSGQWALLREEPKGSYLSRCGSDVKLPLTALQKSWLKSVLQDPRIYLFFSEEEVCRLQEDFKEEPLLFEPGDFYYFDRCQDGDPYGDDTYRRNFRAMTEAVRSRHLIETDYRPADGRQRSIRLFPFRIQYSSKDDKFRVEGMRLKENGRGYSQAITLNMARIVSCQDVGPAYTLPDTEALIASMRAEEPVLIEISGERNSMERCMLHFASYEKRTEYIEERGVYRCEIYYDRQDETELLIQLLSFGPVIRVLGPAPFLRQVKERVERQYHLLHDIIPSSG